LDYRECGGILYSEGLWDLAFGRAPLDSSEGDFLHLCERYMVPAFSAQIRREDTTTKV